jgi:hypothetical protein
VLEDAREFSELFTSTCQADVNTLIPWSSWLTPVGYAKRFDTMFFVAPIAYEVDSEVKYCENEMSEAIWTTSSKIIERSAGKCTTAFEISCNYLTIAFR